jgi:TPR repeat protein
MKNKLYYILLLVSFNTFAQDDIKARIEFEEAEKAFMEEKYEEAISYLEKTEALLGEYSPKISYVKIESLDKITDIYNYEDTNTQKLVSEVQKYLNHFKNNSKDVVVDKYKVVYKIDENLKFAKKNYDDTQTVEFKKANEAYSKKDYATALEWFTKASDKGNAVAMRCIALFYGYGYSVDENYPKAFEWFTKASEKGSIEAMHELIVFYESGLVVSQNKTKVFELLTKVADKDYLSGILDLSIYFAEKKTENPIKSFELIYKAALKGNVDAMYGLGTFFERGFGTTQDYSKALFWYTKAVENGAVEPMFNLAEFYGKGFGVDLDYKIAVDWLLKAASKGHVESLYFLGVAYKEGNGVEKNYLKAAEWYEKALEKEKNHINSLNELSILYETGGYGLKKDKSKAKELRLRYENAKNE